MKRISFLTTSAHGAMSKAHDIADELGHEDISWPHVVLGILETNSLGAAMLLYRGVRPAQLDAELRNALPPAGRPRPLPDSERDWSATDERFVESARQIATEINTPYYGTEHLLLAMLKDKRSAAARLFARYGVDYDTAAKDMQRIMTQHPVDVRPCRADELNKVLEIINAAAEAYRGVIPNDCFHEPYMSADQLQRDVAAGVQFWGYEEENGELVGVMGIQHVDDVDLIRHAYVLPSHQGKGVATVLLAMLRNHSKAPILVGTWADAQWAISFYQRHGFKLVPEEEKAPLLKRYWNISARQIETSVVLA